MRTSASVALCLALGGAACGRTEAPAEKPPWQAPTEAEMGRPLPEPLPEVAARVNGESILTRNLTVIVRQAMAGGKVPEEKKPFLYRDAMYKLITRELLFQEATARRLAPDSSALDKAYDEARTGFRDPVAWEQVLAGQGMTEDAFRTELRIQQTIRALLADESARVAPVTDQEVQSFFHSNPQLFDSGERLRASHILLRVPPDAPPTRKAEVRTRAEGLLARIRTGEDFATLARKHSEDPGSAGKGGDLGTFSRGQMVEPFEQAAYALEVGRVSDVVETPFGFHVIELHGRLPAVKLGLEQVREQVKHQLLEQRRQKNLEALLARLRDKAAIETFL